MLLIAGVVPIEDIPVVIGSVSGDGDSLIVNGYRVPCTQGTAAMLATAMAVTGYLNLEAPQALLAGDTGEGDGSRELYRYLTENVAELSPDVLVLHYWLPNMMQTKQLCEAVRKCRRKPLMIADAGSMYSAKASGMARDFDIFTPDATEIAFLADPEATHPAYIARHLFNADITRAPELVTEAYRNNSAPEYLLVKGATDYIVRDGEILAAISEPNVPELEAIGGTGDTITGLVAGLAYAGFELAEAAVIAARTNRIAGKIAEVTPASRVGDIIEQFPSVFRENLCAWSGAFRKEGED